MSFIDVFYTSDDGLRLYARDYPGPAPDAPCVVCMPGLTRNSKDFAALAESLSDEYRVICPDQRGRGRSEIDPKPEQYRPDRYAQDMRRMLDVMGIERVALIGTSLGGLMALILMVHDSARVVGAVLNDIGPEVDPRGTARIASYVGKLAPVKTWDEAIQRTADINGPSFPEFTRAEWEDMTANTFHLVDNVPVADYDPAISKGIAQGTATPDLWPLFETLAEKAILVIRGELSDILAHETLVEMHRRMPHIGSVEIERVGHAPTLNEPHSRVAIRAFLAQTLQADSPGVKAQQE